MGGVSVLWPLWLLVGSQLLWGWWAGTVSHRKGYSRKGGWVVGLVTGPFGVIILYCLPPDPHYQLHRKR